MSGDTQRRLVFLSGFVCVTESERESEGVRPGDWGRISLFRRSQLVNFNEHHVESVRADPETSDAEAVRECVRRSRRVAELETELQHTEARIDELERELAETRSRLEVSSEIVEYVEAEKTTQERWRQAGLLRKAKWSVFGMDSTDSDGD